jgi:hypothetical protein
MLRATILMLAVLSITGYSIQGNWTLTSARYLDLAKESIVLSVSDYIYKSQSIMQKLTFFGCQKLLLQAQFSEGQLFINGKTYYTEPINNQTCSSSSSAILNSIYSSLNSVFFFEINVDTLLFNDLYGSTVMAFKRIVRKAPVNITGIWNMNQYGNTQTSLSIQISNSQITLCQGNLVLNYTLVPAQNIINLTPVLSTCPSQNLTIAVTASKYFRLNNGILNLYDKTITLTAGLVYSAVFDPAKPIFNSQSSPSTTISATSSAAIGPISISNLAGTWFILSLFNIPLAASPYTLIFTANSIKLTGGCSTYTLSYSINSTTQIINIGTSIPTIASTCSQSDDQLYLSGITKMYKYLMSTTNGVSSLSVYDQTGSIGYSLRSTPSSAPKAAAAAASTPAPAAPPTPLAPGTYLLLLLGRRDLPRVLVTVTSNSLAYKSCNKIQQSFTPARLTGNRGSINF